MGERAAGDDDQAAGLRRLFGSAAARLAPVLIDADRAGSQAAAIVRLAQACARNGERTLLLDCARAHVAASLGLRARFDLLHALRGECSPAQVRLDAGANLCVVPAVRALEQADNAATLLTMLAACAHAQPACDLVVMVVDAAHATLLRTAIRGEIVVPVPRETSGLTGLLRSLTKVAGGADIAGFRLLFPAWDADAAARLYMELVQACGARLDAELRYGGAVRVARDWSQVARAMSEWELVRLPRPQTVRTF